MRYSKEIIREHYNRLPEEVKEFMESEETIKKILDVGKKYQLHMDQINGLSSEVGYVLHGIEKSTDFVGNLTKYVGISEDVANLITYDLNQEIFSKIREELQKVDQGLGQTTTGEGEAAGPKQMFEQKMAGVSNVPKQEVAVEAKTEDNKSSEPAPQAIRDPYREPIE